MRLFSTELSRLRRVVLALVSSVLCTPAVFSGLVLDDYWIASRVRTEDGAMRLQGLLDAFTLARAGELPALLDQGLLPWWTDPEFTIALFRPLAALSHALDFWAFPQAPWLMHLESLTVLFGLHLVVLSFYARLFPDAPRVATLAMLLYALAPGHGFAASWLANRNACLAALFAALCLRWHDRSSQGAGSRYAPLALVALVASLLSGELGVSTLALLVAHAVCLDPRSGRARIVALMPALSIVALWAACYRALGFGAHASSLYVDFGRDPGAYLEALLTRIPILLFGQWVLPLSSFTPLLSRAATITFALIAVLSLSLFARPVWQLIRSDERAQFAAMAALLSLLPVAATLPHDRLLVVSDLGGHALLALAVEHAVGRLGRALWLATRLRLAVCLIMTPLYAASLFDHAAASKTPFAATLRDDDLRRQTLVFVNAPCSYFTALLPLTRRFEGAPVPDAVHALAPGIYPLEIARVDDHTLVLRASHGLLQPSGTWMGDGPERVGAVSAVYVAQALSQFSRASATFRLHDQVRVRDLSIEVRSLTETEGAQEVRFRFDRTLDDPTLRFLIWQEGRPRPFTLPPPGQVVRLAPVLE